MTLIQKTTESLRAQLTRWRRWLAFVRRRWHYWARLKNLVRMRKWQKLANEAEAHTHKLEEELKHKPPPPPPPPKPSRLEGIDYSEGNGITAEQIKRAGKHFVCRYLSEEGNPKNIDKQETWNLLNAGLSVVLVWETTAHRMLAGKLGGVSDAFAARQEVERLGLGQIPIYFAADFDATEQNQGPINAYLDGASQAIGKRRVGIYGGYWPVKRAFDAKKTTYGWQTYAWSGGKWDPRAQLQQYENGVFLHQAEVDLDRSTHVDFGQWPRP